MDKNVRVAENGENALPLMIRKSLLLFEKQSIEGIVGTAQKISLPLHQ